MVKFFFTILWLLFRIFCVSEPLLPAGRNTKMIYYAMPRDRNLGVHNIFDAGGGGHTKKISTEIIQEIFQAQASQEKVHKKAEISLLLESDKNCHVLLSRQFIT